MSSQAGRPRQTPRQAQQQQQQVRMGQEAQAQAAAAAAAAAAVSWLRQLSGAALQAPQRVQA
jgi:hypothetical protein